MAASRGRRKEHHEEEPDERWLITYADMITLLMVLFIVLFAISQVDQKKFAELSGGLAVGFGGEKPGLPGGDGVLTGRQHLSEDEISLNPIRTGAGSESDAAADRAELSRAQSALQQALEGAGLSNSANLELSERGLVITLVTDEILFASGDATLAAEGARLLDVVGPVLKALPNHVSVEGHTDNVPIRGRYPSNWELSSARATAVLATLINREGLAPERMSATGFADTRPLVPMDTRERRARNRRVEVVVLARPLAPDASEAAAVEPIVPDLSKESLTASGAVSSTEEGSDG